MNRESTPPTKIPIIVGATASGKSDYAIRLAHEIDGEIISADSRQVYRGMDIGSGKVTRDPVTGHLEPVEGSPTDITRKENIEADFSTRRLTRNDTSFVSGGIRHHLIDIASPKRTYTVTHFLRDAKAAIEDIQKRGKIPIICGGTNFWIEALVFDSTFPAVKPDSTLRKTLGRLTTPELYVMLERKDPERAESIDRHNKVRLIRALEIVATLGKVPKDGIKNNESGIKLDEREGFRFIGIDLPKDVLHEHIEKRLKERLEKGMIEEVKRLHEREGLSWKRLDGFGLEYRWCARFLQGKISRDEITEAVLKDIRYYAKRQLSSLRRLERKGIRIEWVGKNF